MKIVTYYSNYRSKFYMLTGNCRLYEKSFYNMISETLKRPDVTLICFYNSYQKGIGHLMGYGKGPYLLLQKRLQAHLSIL